MNFNIDEYKEITNKEDIYKIIHGFIFAHTNEGLKNTLNKFSQKRGQSSEYVVVSFGSELSPYENPENRVSENHVLLSADEPAVDEACEAIINFSDFSEFIERAIYGMLKNYSERYNESEIRKALDEFKEALNSTKV